MTDHNANSGRATRIIAGALLVLVVLWAHYYMPSQISALTADAIRSLHGPGFGIVALIVVNLGRFSGGPAARYLKSGAATMLLAILAEAAQIPGPREAELGDLLIDALGIIGFLGFAAALDHELRSKIGTLGTVAIVLVSLPAFAAATASTGWLSYALVKRNQALPQLLSFDETWEQTYANGNEVDYDVIPAPEGWPAGSGKIARLHSAGKSGLMLHLRTYPDWSNYVAVSFIAATTGDETRRIALGLWGLNLGDGTLPGRYYTRAKISPIPARYCIMFDELPDHSSERPFNLNYVSQLTVGATKNERGVTIYVDDFRLERSTDDCKSG